VCLQIDWMLPVLLAAAVSLVMLLLSVGVIDAIANVCAAPAAACCTVAPANAATTVGIHLHEYQITKCTFQELAQERRY
jgi:hypothetical protein